MATSIVIPDFPYSAHFYAEILEDLVSYMRTNVPELTDEDPTEPHMQMLRAFALSYHLNACLLDLVANESFLPTAKLRASHVALLALIDFQLAQAVPASTDLVATLTQTFTAALTIVPANSAFATMDSKAAQSIPFETLVDVGVTLRTDEVGATYEFTNATGVYTDHTTDAQSPTGSFSLSTWTPQNGDALYIGHPDVMFDQVNIIINVAPVNVVGVWEYYDGNYDQGQPDTVTNLGSTLKFGLNTLLGASDMTGTVVRVRSAVTGHYQDISVVYAAGTNTITTSGVDPFLGQSSPSVIATDYIVGTAWRVPTGLVDGTTGLAATGALTFTLPQTVGEQWTAVDVGNGTPAMTGFWLRFRVISVGATPAAPSITQVRIDEGKQYLLFEVTQGTTQNDNPLGSSNGSASQEFTFSQFPVIDDANIIVTVNESGVDQVYARVDNFLNSVPTDRHYTIEFDDDGAAIITFGDGTNGKVPPAGVNNIRATYRTMDDVDGNVGANTINVNQAGVAWLSSVSNPRSASGYNIREGSTPADLARIKIAGPASLRTRERAVATQDVETVTTQYVATDGSKPVARALAIEESFGVKTVEVVVVGPGGNLVDASKLSEIQDYFNGTDTTRGVLVLNHQLTATNFTQHSVDLVMTLTGGSATAVITALVALLNPLALNSDGTYTWAFGGTVPLAKIIQTIMDTTPSPTNVLITSPAADVVLGTRELPVAGHLTINGVAYQ